MDTINEKKDKGTKTEDEVTGGLGSLFGDTTNQNADSVKKKTFFKPTGLVTHVKNTINTGASLESIVGGPSVQADHSLSKLLQQSNQSTQLKLNTPIVINPKYVNVNQTNLQASPFFNSSIPPKSNTNSSSSGSSSPIPITTTTNIKSNSSIGSPPSISPSFQQISAKQQQHLASNISSISNKIMFRELSRNKITFISMLFVFVSTISLSIKKLAYYYK